jgi:hypothetical protein
MAIVPPVDPFVAPDLAVRLPTLSGERASEVECDWERIAWNNLLYDAPKDSVYTNHALMVPYGQLAQELGLVSELLEVPVPQKEYDHKPAKKVMEYLMGILSGMEYLKDLNEGPYPLVKDQAVIEAWGQENLAHYSGVSRTLAASDDETVAAVKDVLNDIFQPIIDHERAVALQRDGCLIWDGDLTGRKVSSTSTTYPGAAFGWQGDEVGLGYQAALICMASPTYGRLWLAGFHHPGDTVSVECTEELIRGAEERARVRPRRRVELVDQRLEALARKIDQRRRWASRQEARRAQAEATCEQLREQIPLLQQEAEERLAWHEGTGRPVKPHSLLNQVRRRLASCRRRLARAEERIEEAVRIAAKHRKRVQDLQADYDELRAWRDQLQADNDANPNPTTIFIRLDAGFGSGADIAWLIEMGYTPYTKAYNDSVTQALKRRVNGETTWTRVGRNAEMTAWGDYTIANCPYPLTVALERFHLPEETKYSTLICYRDDGQMLTLPAWFDFYNGRQTIEAGNKEEKGVFKMRNMKMRSPAGIILQEVFTRFSANFTRLAGVWLRQKVQEMSRPLDKLLASVKQMVRVGANTSAWVIRNGKGCLLLFAQGSPYEGLGFLLDGEWCLQLPLGLFKVPRSPP